MSRARIGQRETSCCRLSGVTSVQCASLSVCRRGHWHNWISAASSRRQQKETSSTCEMVWFRVMGLEWCGTRRCLLCFPQCDGMFELCFCLLIDIHLSDRSVLVKIYVFMSKLGWSGLVSVSKCFAAANNQIYRGKRHSPAIASASPTLVGTSQWCWRIFAARLHSGSSSYWSSLEKVNHSQERS